MSDHHDGGSVLADSQQVDSSSSEVPTEPSSSPSTHDKSNQDAVAIPVENKGDEKTDIEAALSRQPKSKVENMKYQEPTAKDFLIDGAMALYKVANPVVVMFTTLVPAAEKMHSQSSSAFEVFLVIYICLYPLFSMMLVINMFSNSIAKKYYYYRLLAYGTVMDFKDRSIFKSVYLYFFLVSTACIWIITAKTDGSVVVLVVLQTSQLLIFIRSVYQLESSLVTVNKFVEIDFRHQTQLLTTFDFVHEDDVRRDILAVLKHVKLDKKTMSEEEMSKTAEDRGIHFGRLGLLQGIPPATVPPLLSQPQQRFQWSLWATSTLMGKQKYFAESRDRAFGKLFMMGWLACMFSVVLIEIYGFYRLDRLRKGQS